jgi:tryptophan synthase beta subunit
MVASFTGIDEAADPGDERRPPMATSRSAGGGRTALISDAFIADQSVRLIGVKPGRRSAAGRGRLRLASQAFSGITQFTCCRTRTATSSDAFDPAGLDHAVGPEHAAARQRCGYSGLKTTTRSRTSCSCA